MLQILLGALGLIIVASLILVTKKAAGWAVNVVIVVGVITLAIYAGTVSVSSDVSGLADRVVPSAYRNSVPLNLAIPQLQQGVDLIEVGIDMAVKHAQKQH